MSSFFDCTGPSIQLFNDEEHQERFVIAYGSSTPPAIPLGFKMEFKYARVLSGYTAFFFSRSKFYNCSCTTLNRYCGFTNTQICTNILEFREILYFFDRTYLLLTLHCSGKWSLNGGERLGEGELIKTEEVFRIEDLDTKSKLLRDI